MQLPESEIEIILKHLIGQILNLMQILGDLKINFHFHSNWPITCLKLKNSDWSDASEGYSQLSISLGCRDYFYKFEVPEVQIDLHFG